MLAEFLFRPFEALLNHGLQQSAEAQALATALEGRCLGLTMEGTPFDLRLRVKNGRLDVGLPDGAAPDACISGGPLSLGRLLREEPQAAVRDGAVRMTGDTEIAEQFRELLRLASPDLEKELARLVGEPVAQQVGDTTRAFGRWTGEAGDGLARGVSEYLQRDSQVLPTAEEAREFARKVDELTNDVARAEARIQRLWEKK
jgi:ubiquinone biosynthesis protein UbiJ